ncbi:hypothetical protein [Polyangium spumosum]|uniref:Uncharacterized protein n=1 Tax=Polyangium spumosum TaxID=889282 RepID=A0A6N7QCA3_9BACT|nr:hypothetical protein [Polyangium spumosum]MRG98511.1 hypothetical protein [Polyangium spumosum]
MMTCAEKAALVALLRRIAAAMRGMAEDFDAIASLLAGEASPPARVTPRRAKPQARYVDAPDLTDDDHRRASESLRRIGMHPRDDGKRKR